MLDVDEAVVLHLWKRIVEMMQQGRPVLGIGRLPEANRVILELHPLNKKREAIFLFKAFVKLEGFEPRHRRNNSPGLGERALELRFLTRNDVENGQLENH